MVTMTDRLLSRSVRRVGWGWVVKLTSGQYHHLSQRPLQKSTVVVDVHTQCVHNTHTSIEGYNITNWFCCIDIPGFKFNKHWFNEQVHQMIQFSNRSQNEQKCPVLPFWKLVLLTFTLSPYSWQAARETFSVKVCFLVFSAHVRRARVSHLCLFVTVFTSELACVILVACV